MTCDNVTYIYNVTLFQSFSRFVDLSSRTYAIYLIIKLKHQSVFGIDEN